MKWLTKNSISSALGIFGVYFKVNTVFTYSDFAHHYDVKGIVMQIEKALINDHLRVSKVCVLNFCFSIIYNFAVIYP